MSLPRLPRSLRRSPPRRNTAVSLPDALGFAMDTSRSYDDSIAEPSDASHTSSSLMSRWSDSSAFPEGGVTTTLLGGLHLHPDGDDRTSAGIPNRPRRLWNVSDTKVPLYPPFWPHPTNSVVIDGVSPAVIAIRVQECLWKRSIAVEYDDEAAEAHCVTSDRCQFTVHLWRRATLGNVTVECVRIAGNPITYHRTVQAIVQAAESLDSGADQRAVYQAFPTEYPRLRVAPPEQSDLHTSFYNSGVGASSERQPSATSLIQTKPTRTAEIIAVEALEQAFQFLCKDRLEAQLSGMQSLVALTDVSCSGLPVATIAGLVVLGDERKNPLLRQLHTDWILSLLVDRELPSERIIRSPTNASDSCSSASSLFDGEVKESATPENLEHKIALTPHRSETESWEDQHASEMRALALRAFANALSVLANEQPELLRSLLSNESPGTVAAPVLAALQVDLLGACRPATVSSRLATPHEAALAAKCLGLLAQHNDLAKRTLMKDDTLLLRLEKAAAVGRSTHAIMAAEARRTFHLLTEEDRSC